MEKNSFVFVSLVICSLLLGGLFISGFVEAKKVGGKDISFRSFSSEENESDDDLDGEFENETEEEDEVEFEDENETEFEDDEEDETRERLEERLRLRYEDEGNKIREEIRQRFVDSEGNEVEVRARVEIRERNGEIEEKYKIRMSNGRDRDVKVLPERASERAREVFRSRNVSVVLKEVGEGNNLSVVYEALENKSVKFLGLFKVRARLKAIIDADSGEVVELDKPWWYFLATGKEDIREAPLGVPQNSEYRGKNETEMNESIGNETEVENETEMNESIGNETMINESIS